MSIAALKRKTLNGNPRLAPISGSNNGNFGFSLNGTRRNIGSVGVTNLAPGAQTGPTQMISSSLGNITNNYGISGHATSCCRNDENIVKPSVINTRGMLSRRINCLPPQPEYRSCNGCNSGNNPPSGCYNWVKKQLYSGDQGEYIKNVVRISGVTYSNSIDSSNNYCNITKSTNGILGLIDENGKYVLNFGDSTNCGNSWDGKGKRPNHTFIGTKRITTKCNIAKPGILTVDYSTYIHKQLMQKKCLPQTGDNLSPWVLNSTHGSGCKNPDYTTITPP